MGECTLSKAEEQDLKEKILKDITNSRFLLVVNYPFIGAIALHLTFVPVRDENLSTAATDGSHIFFDMDFYMSLSENERCFVIAHETWHCIMLHFLRRQTRDANIFNIAADMEVNNIIIESSDDASFRPPTGALLPPPELKGSSAELLYEYLIKKQKKQSQKNNSGISGNDPWNGESDNFPGNYSSHQNSESSGSKKLKGQWDRHTYQGSDNRSGDGKHSSKTDRWGEKGHDPDFCPKVSQHTSERIREYVIAEAQKEMRSKGKLPAGIENLVKQYQQPEIKWQEQLAQFVTIVYGDKRYWLPPSRRHVHEELYLQSRRSERINVVVAIDTSGSCVGDLPKFFGELVSLINSFGNYEITVIYCDAEVAQVDTYDQNNPLVPDNGIKWSGGGGTSFRPPFKYLSEHGIIPDCFIYFTDGFGDAPERSPGYPVLWVLTSDGDRNFCNWGTKIRFKNNKYE